MTIEQCKKIYRYNEVRNLYSYDIIKEVGYKIEEIDEYFKAKNEIDKIDALADIIIFATGSLYKKGIEPKEYTPTLYNVNILNVISDLFNDVLVIENCLRIIDYMGYDYIKVINETIKHIESRKGEINKKTGKFEKYKGSFYEGQWYNHDYSLCLK